MSDAAMPPSTPPITGAHAAGIFGRLLNFDHLIGTGLVKLMYFLGLIGIALSAVFGLIGSLAAMTQSFVAGLGALLLSAIGLLIGILIWRFTCELAIMAFLAVDRLGEIRDRLPPAGPRTA